MGNSIWSPNELYHHGVAGQKWGKKNGLPYPLSEEDHSAAEKKEALKSTMKSYKKDNKTAFKFQKKLAKRMYNQSGGLFKSKRQKQIAMNESERMKMRAKINKKDRQKAIKKSEKYIKKHLNEFSNEQLEYGSAVIRELLKKNTTKTISVDVW